MHVRRRIVQLVHFRNKRSLKECIRRSMNQVILTIKFNNFKQKNGPTISRIFCAEPTQSLRVTVIYRYRATLRDATLSVLLFGKRHTGSIRVAFSHARLLRRARPRHARDKYNDDAIRESTGKVRERERERMVFPRFHPALQTCRNLSTEPRWSFFTPRIREHPAGSVDQRATGSTGVFACKRIFFFPFLFHLLRGVVL